MSFNARLILQNLLALTLIWAVLLTQPLLGYAFIALAAVYAWNHHDPAVAEAHWIGVGVGLLLWSFAAAFPIATGYVMTAMVTLNVAVLIWLRRPVPMATRR